MSWPEVQAMFAGIANGLKQNGLFITYGPFNFNNEYTSESNQRFDAMLRANDPASGIRNFEDLDKLAGTCGMRFKQKFEMPVNNFILVWQKQ
jgi:hypothetical protein